VSNEFSRCDETGRAAVPRRGRKRLEINHSTEMTNRKVPSHDRGQSRRSLRTPRAITLGPSGEEAITVNGRARTPRIERPRRASERWFVPPGMPPPCKKTREIPTRAAATQRRINLERTRALLQMMSPTDVCGRRACVTEPV